MSTGAAEVYPVDHCPICHKKYRAKWRICVSCFCIWNVHERRDIPALGVPRVRRRATPNHG